MNLSVGCAVGYSVDCSVGSSRGARWSETARLAVVFGPDGTHADGIFPCFGLERFGLPVLFDFSFFVFFPYALSLFFIHTPSLSLLSLCLSVCLSIFLSSCCSTFYLPLSFSECNETNAKQPKISTLIHNDGRLRVKKLRTSQVLISGANGRLRLYRLHPLAAGSAAISAAVLLVRKYGYGHGDRGRSVVTRVAKLKVRGV